MTVDVLIVADEVDDIRKYIPTIVESFRLVHNNIHVDIASTAEIGNSKVYKAKRLLLLLCGSKERATILCRQWRQYLKVTRFTKEKILTVITASEQPLGITTDDTENAESCSIVCCESLDHIEDWVPEFVQTFFPLWNNHKTSIGIYNRSPEYPLATETTDSLVKTFTRLEIEVHCNKASPNEPLKFEASVKSCVFVLRSSIRRHRDVIDKLYNNSKDICSIYRVYVVSTQHTSITGGSSFAPKEFSRLEIVECIVKLLAGLQLIKPQNSVKKLKTLLVRQTGPKAILFFKVIFTIVVFLMNLMYGILVCTLVLIGNVFAFDILPDIFHITCTDVDGSRFEFLGINRNICQFIYNIIMTIILTSICWTVGLTLELASVPILVVITIVIILYFIVWYTILHILLFKIKLGYEFGAFSLPYIWWQ